MRSLNVFTWSVVAVVVALHWHSAEAAELPDGVKGILDSAGRAFEVVAIEWRSQQSSPIDDVSRRTIHRGLASPSLFSAQTFSYRFDRGRWLYVANTPSASFGEDGEYNGKTSECVLSLSFDGTVLETGQTGTVHSRLQFQKLLAEGPDSMLGANDYWELAGWKVPQTAAEQAWFLEQGVRGVMPLLSFLLKRGFELPVEIVDENLEMVLCKKVTLTKGREKVLLWCDPELGWAVRRWERREEGTDQVLATYRLGKFEKVDVPENVWCPHLCTAEYVEFQGLRSKRPGEVLIVREVALTAVTVGQALNEDDLRLKYPPGMQVYDEVHPRAKEAPAGAISYQVPADPRDLDAAVDRALYEQVEGPERQSRRLFWIIAVNVFGLGIAVIAFVVLRRRRGRNDSRA